MPHLKRPPRPYEDVLLPRHPVHAQRCNPPAPSRLPYFFVCRPAEQKTDLAPPYAEFAPRIARCFLAALKLNRPTTPRRCNLLFESSLGRNQEIPHSHN